MRRQGIQFAMITLAFSQFIYFIFLQAPFTGGEDGMQSIPRNDLFGFVDITSNLTLYYVVLAIHGAVRLRLSTASSIRPWRGAQGHPRQRAARRVRSASPGTLKLVAFILSASMAGVAGGTKAVVFQFATLTDVSWPISGEVVLMTLLGGLGTVFGPVVGSRRDHGDGVLHVRSSATGSASPRG